ncbi:MAG TPA: preprotein translocase subunit YajC [Leptospiraceae bacterium]|nr:preprotein translocase subunit YajC [Leptospiraceae bacterium]HMW06075.1 preprotein translocase subunit YajC [Leptospiraceae bacterium]HMX33363.1 preprotein translocase subunit YajC [Leptospiraceae bacterium]HMY31383.1 preprotein translocase subunit YajC [Leptospiraceae bacterium]HMZ64997.1 preprotein translocase subunit YajC [Leptospiraceae bacterium]
MYLLATFQYLIYLAQDAGGQSSSLSALILFPIMLVIMYFLVIQPQRKEEKKKQEMIQGLVKGDSVVTTSGIHGKVVEFKDNNESVVLNVAKETNITFSTSAILKKKS